MEKLIVFTDEDIRAFTKDFSEKRTIGVAGAFGQVYRGRISLDKYPDCPRKVAVKISKQSKVFLKLMFEQEIQALSSISHPNVIKLVGYADLGCDADLGYYALVYERAQRDLQDYTASTEEDLNLILVGAARGLRAVHDAGFVHWDIKVQNVLLMKDGTVKIADFGLATRREDKMEYFELRNAGQFNSNDTEDAKEMYDVFCFGHLLRTLTLRTHKEWSPTHTPRTMVSDDCIKNDPDTRPSTSEVVSRLEKIQMDQMAPSDGEGTSSRKRKKC